MKKTRPVLGLTMGDPAGIGPEICLRALLELAVNQACVPVLFGDVGVLQRVAGKQFSKLAGSVVSLAALAEIKNISQPLIVDCAAIKASAVKPGKVSAACGRAGYVYIEQAIRAALAGQIAGVVTAPIHKESLNRSGVKFPGHTEIFTALTQAARSCMMLYSEKLTVSMATTHIGYHEVPQKLSVARILNVIEHTAETMRWMLRREPRIGVCGLNPHAGEHGLFGQREEEKFVTPAVTQARKKGLQVTGPLVPDAAFTVNVRKNFDALVTLYHDQGHIPFKMLAFDIAWQGKADPTSLFSAIQVATELAAGKSKGARR